MSDSERESAAAQDRNEGETADISVRVDAPIAHPPATPSAEGAVTVLPPRRSLRGQWNGERMSERHRAAIQTHALLKRLNKIGKGRVAGTPAHLAVQVQAMKVLLAKSLPDIQNVVISGDGDAPLVILTRME